MDGQLPSDNRALPPGIAPPPAKQPFPLAKAIVIGTFLLAIPLTVVFIFAALSQVREQVMRIECRSNLKQIGLMALSYANSEMRTGGVFPRTYFDGAAMPTISADNSGYATAASFVGPPALVGSPSAVAPNNVPASFYLIMKCADMAPYVFLCPSAEVQRPFGPGTSVGVQDCSNWPDLARNLSYSYNCLFPTDAALKNGWRWDKSLGAQDPMAADKNPGKGNPMANGSGLTDVTAVKYDDGRGAMARGSSNNHNNAGQNVLYCDGHVEWCKSPFAGRVRPGYLFRDNIYTANRGGGLTPARADGSGDDLTNQHGPGDPADSYLLPTCSKTGF